METVKPPVGRTRRIVVLKRLFELEPADRRTLARAFGALAWMSFALRFRGFRQLFTAIEQTKPAVIPSGEDLRRARTYARWISAASRHHLVRANCLERSLVLHRWLRREGLPSVLRIGVRTDEGKLIAHAWIEITGEPLGDRPDALGSFRTFDGLEAAALVGSDLRTFDRPRAVQR
jgi:hypothetical protein